jgi:hypothetical protein
MDTFKALRLQAKAKRDKARKAAQTEYHADLAEIRRLRAMLMGPLPTVPRKFNTALLPAPRDDAYRVLSTVEAASRAIRQHGPLTIVEIVIDIQSHGHRSGDDPRRIVRAISTGFRKYPTRFSCDADKRWSVV